MSISSEGLESLIYELEKERDEWKEAARSEAQMLNEERERSKILLKALEKAHEDFTNQGFHKQASNVLLALAKYRGEVC